MAISWLAVLKAVPWSEVIGNAPAVAEGAKKLWNTVSGRQDAPVRPPPAASSPAPGSTALQSRVALLDAAVSDLHAQMLASSGLIKALADQNTELIRRIETLRVRMLWLAGAVGVLAVAGIVLLLARVAG
jgi:hypothetical protein